MRRRAPLVERYRDEITEFFRQLIPVVFGLALFVAAISLRGLDERQGGNALETAALILGDSVVPVHEGAARADTVGERFLDTLRIVEFVLRGPSVRSATVVGVRIRNSPTGRIGWRTR